MPEINYQIAFRKKSPVGNFGDADCTLKSQTVLYLVEAVVGPEKKYLAPPQTPQTPSRPLAPPPPPLPKDPPPLPRGEKK